MHYILWALLLAVVTLHWLRWILNSFSLVKKFRQTIYKI